MTERHLKRKPEEALLKINPFLKPSPIDELEGKIGTFQKKPTLWPVAIWN